VVVGAISTLVPVGSKLVNFPSKTRKAQQLQVKKGL
jgi:hypothetical protein